MRRRALAAVPVLLAALALGAPAAQGDALKMYGVTVGEQSVGVLDGLGVDLGHTGYRASLDRAQTIFVDLIDAQAREARDNGLALQEVTPGPHLSENQIAQRLEAAENLRSAQALDKPETGGDSLNRSTTSSAPIRSPAG